MCVEVGRIAPNEYAMNVAKETTRVDLYSLVKKDLWALDLDLKQYTATISARISTGSYPRMYL